ncbi:BLOC-1-related complex subunit 6 isoform X1 [Scleropages formosus]|uniref:BLOC-1 related complex subunit 6 n=1 Tax=Scleropages formosus TaxID=113540 RepID=A0A8C9S0Z6_SCLFO|nr:BLOC-1-related complex subunit 6 isoform X1 [Scleropages formosus]
MWRVEAEFDEFETRHRVPRITAAAERMSHSPGTGSAVHTVSNGLDSPGSLSSSDEECSNGLQPTKCAERVPGCGLEPAAVSPAERELNEGEMEGGRQPPCEEGCVDTTAVSLCTTDPSDAGSPHENRPYTELVYAAAAGNPAAKSLKDVKREERVGTKQVDEQEETAGTRECSAAAQVFLPPAVRDGLPPDVPSEEHAGSPSPLQGHKASHPPHVMAQVHVRAAPERERIVRGMQDSKSLDEISQACGGARGPPEGRRATISSALELEGTVSHDGDVTHFITRNLEHKIKMSSRPSLDSDSHGRAQNRGLFDRSGQSRGSLRPPADIPPIDPGVLLDLHRQAQEVAQSVELVMRGLGRTIQNMTALSVGYIQTYRDSVDSVGESVDMSIKGMYTLMARCEELDRSMQPIHALAKQIRDIKQTLDILETLCK